MKYNRQQVFALLGRVRRHRAAKFAVLWLVAYLVLMSFFFSTIVKNFTYIEIFPRELLFPSLLHAVTALIIALSLFWLPWLRTFSSKLVAGLMFALLLVGYDGNMLAVSGIIRAFVPGLTESDTLVTASFVYLVLLFGASVLVGVGSERVVRRFKKLQSRDVGLGVLVLVAYVFIVPTFSLATILPTLVRETRTQAPLITQAGQANADAKDKPDIYYIVLDRYASANVLKNQFNYDNAPFTGFLRDKGFTVNDQANSNYPYTTMSVASTLNAQYTSDLVAPYKDSSVQSRALYHNLIRQSSVAKALKSNGYKYYSIGSDYGATYKAPLADYDVMRYHDLKIFGSSKHLRGIEVMEFIKSPYYRFAQNLSWSPLNLTEHERIGDVRAQLTALDGLAEEEPGGRFIFAHILVPHDPYVFNSDGSLSMHPDPNSVGLPIKQKYTAQVEFINTQMRELVSSIDRNSNGKAVIILNADEGPYPQLLNDTFKKPQNVVPTALDVVTTAEDMRDWTDDWAAMKFGILQAVHIPEATDADLANLSSVNVFRIVLNRYLGYDLSYLPNCNFGLIRGSQNEYNYAVISDKLTSTPDAACKQYESLPSR